jgi:hypothetical protein
MPKRPGPMSRLHAIDTSTPWVSIVPRFEYSARTSSRSPVSGLRRISWQNSLLMS